MYSQAPGLVLRSGSPTLVKRCFSDVWTQRLRLVSEEEGGSEEGEQAMVEKAVGGTAAPVAALARHRRRASQITAADEAFRQAVEFLQFVMASVHALPFSLSIVAQELRKDIYLLYHLPGFNSAAFLRIGNPVQSLTSVIRRWSRRNLLCSPVCKDVQKTFDMELKAKRKIARSLSRHLRVQVGALKSIAKSMSIVGTVRSSELSDSFEVLEMMGKRPEKVSPGSLDLCSLHLRGLAATPLPICGYEAVPFRYALEAFRLTLAQRGMHVSTWFRFFAMNHEAIINNCISEAKRLSAKHSLEDFTKVPEWRRMLPTALENGATALLDRFADLKSLIYLMEGRVDTRGFRRGIRSVTHKVVQWLLRPKGEKKISRRKALARREEAEIEVQDTITLSELESLPEDVIINAWRSYSLSVDSSEEGGMHFDRTNRFLAAVGTGFRCAQMFLNDQKIFFGELKGNKAAEEVIQRLAAEFFVSPGAPPDGFRALRAEATKAVVHYCKGKANICKVADTTELASNPLPDSCERPTVFCTQALACAEARSNDKRILLDSDCLLRLVDELLTNPPPLISLDVVLKALAPVLSQFPFTIVIWNQINATVTQFKQKHDVLIDSIPIQLIIAPRQTPEGLSASQPVSFAQDETNEEDEIFYSATAPEPPQPPARSLPAENVGETEVFIVGPGFDLYERLREARRAIANESLLTESDIDASLFDQHLLQSLTAFQLFVACAEIPTDCRAFKTEFYNKIKTVLLKAKEEGESTIRLGRQQQRRLDSLRRLKEGIEHIDGLTSQALLCLTEECREDTTALLKIFKPIQGLLGDPRYRELKKEALFERASTFTATVPLDPFTKASHLTLPYLPMQQWLEVLQSLRLSPALFTAKPVVLRSISSIESTCFEISRRRLKSALMVLQKAAEQMSTLHPL
ncbi:hypothetical protein, conserved [Eimeria praecox]|uniref:Uncharacterized protein n=1 Tax=Eimeria praecox TaxID=51316 RepID=U6H489_9EIME|nr:hypothetical protein, conserved [Eimeria praecox]